MREAHLVEHTFLRDATVEYNIGIASFAAYYEPRTSNPIPIHIMLHCNMQSQLQHRSLMLLSGTLQRNELSNYGSCTLCL